MKNSLAAFIKSELIEVTEQVLFLPAHQNILCNFVVDDKFGGSILWVNDENIYDFHGHASLNFVFALTNRNVRNTARISNRITKIGSKFTEAQLYQTRMRIFMNGVTKVLTLALCKSDVLDVPAILTTKDYLRFRQA